MNVQSPAGSFKPQDFASDQEVRWCPGCGDYAILKSVQRALAEIGTPPDKTAVISGIGCAARFPYYLATYGFHTIHGRAPAIATGTKLARPELDVWVVGGDGDILSIGGNHTLHALRRNVDLNILLFNNEIYGLTKGQYSPTSRLGTRSPTTPQGSVDAPVSACSVALGAGARFVARMIDTDQKRLPAALVRAHGHKGASFVEILQNCIVYNDGVYGSLTDKATAPNNRIFVEHGQKLIFGADGEKGLRIVPGTLELEIVTIGENGVSEDDILVHDETNRSLATLLAQMEGPDWPTALGILYCNPAEPLGEAMRQQAAAVAAKNPAKSLNELLRAGRIWTVADK